ncbi:MAG: diaminopimelate decarboxylase [Dysgonamonadaceae bacterium]|jgi:diaminopimelate decarboxylase|nr:diaminopimelate decarboxylase [Dysgonamonadaceae bacterium]
MANPFTSSVAEKLKKLQTPFYYYDTEVLKQTLQALTGEAGKYGYQVHYAVKANANPRILSIIKDFDIGADCVSGGEIEAALNAGFPASKIVFAGVGKADWEIELGLDNDIFCFNAESLPELEIIDELAARKGKTANVALRINPDVDAHTHQHITTGTKENKFGINIEQLDAVLDRMETLKHLNLVGIHFHIGSQILDFEPFETLCAKLVEIEKRFSERGIFLKNINFGGGLGIDYENPDEHPIPDFKRFFATINRHFTPKAGQTVHFEPGRSVVAQCGTLISKVLYIKEGSFKRFAILDAGFTELIRPALYDAYHKIENISARSGEAVYDVVGPICESSDTFGKDVKLPVSHRGDLFALRSAGAYGEIMASQYNCRKLPKSYFSDQI